MNNCLKDLREGMKYYMKVSNIVEQAYNFYEEEFGFLNEERKGIKFFEFIKNSQEYQSGSRRRLTYRHPLITVDLIVDEQS